MFDLFVRIKLVEFLIEFNLESYIYEKGLVFKKYGINCIFMGV